MARSMKRRSRRSRTRRHCPGGSGERVAADNRTHKDELLLALRLALTVWDFAREWLDSGSGPGRIR